MRAAGAETAKLLIIAIDDQEKTVELAQTARAAFPKLTILARAWDRRHAYDLLRNGADKVERETFEGALALGQQALKTLGLRAHQAYRATSYFRRHDRRVFEELAPLWGEEERYILASRDANQTTEKLLRADMERLRPTEDDDWTRLSLDEEMEEEPGPREGVG